MTGPLYAIGGFCSRYHWPTIAVWLGRRAWWLPGWLDRFVPHLSIEGEEYFARRDAAPADNRGD